MTDTMWTAIITGSATLILAGLAKLFGKRDTAYDQIQEDLEGMRTERAHDRDAAIREREKDRVEMAYLQELVIHLNNEVLGLYEGVERHNVPPLPARPPWPKRPEIKTA